MPYEFKRSDVYGLASALGAETHERGEELFFRWCPYCKGGGHDKNTFSVNLENGTFKCFRAGCGAQGHLVQLARDFGYPLEFDDGRKKKYRTLPQRPVKVTNPAVRYLESRGISRAVTERYRITTQRGHDNILVFPFYDGDGVMQFVKYRKTDFVKGRDRNKEWSEKDTMPILFGMDRCEGKDRLVITEGQIDSLSLTEAGIQNAVSVPTGAMGFTWLENVWEWINGFAEVIVFGDCEKGKITLVDAASTDTQYLKQSHFVRQLKQLAVKHNIAVLLVAHPRKTQGDVSENDAVSGSADITNRVDTVISYVKNGEDAPAGGKLLVLKNRMTGKLALHDNAIAVGYDEKSKRVYSAAGRNDFRYGWEKESVSPLAMEDLPF